jgi:two-component system sporulation sensor kinase A
MGDVKINEVSGEIYMPKSLFGSGNESVLYDPDELIVLFLNCTADGFAILGMDNRFIRINHMYTKVFGYTEKDVIGRRFDKVPNSDQVKKILEQVKSGKAFTNLITQSYHKDGILLDIAVSYSPFRNIAGDIIGLINIFRDITELVNMERELKRTRELYKLITDNTTDMIKIFSRENKIVYASPSHEKGVGFHPKQLIGRNVYDVIIPEEKEHFERVFQNLVETGEPQLIQIKLRTNDNSIIYCESNISPILNEKKEIESYVAVGRNITDRIKKDAALRNLGSLSIIGQLAAGVAHEIRNPLTSLKGFSKLLKGTTDKEKQEEYLAIITNELDRIDMIVNEFMSLAKPQEIQFERDNLISILDSTINVLHPQALLHNVQIKINYLKENIELLCSPNQLKQVFVNFLKNAIEAMSEGGTVHIDVQRVENKKVMVSFTDEGTGIDNDLLRYLGTLFFTTKDKGMGLGLTVSNKIIQEHNGTMKIESQIGTGTTVKVELEVL